MTAKRTRIAFASTSGGWGGSEDLWSGAALALAAGGHEVSIYKARLDREFEIVQRLHALARRMIELDKLPLPTRFNPSLARISDEVAGASGALRFELGLRRDRPDLVVISQPNNIDSFVGWRLARVARRLKLRYVLIAQHASNQDWPRDVRLDAIRAAYRHAEHSYFVSQHNRTLAEEQVGFRLKAASVVRNPFRVSWQPRDDWPDQGELRLACIGRLEPKHKGQDILLRVLAMPKWCNRPLSLSLFGKGPREEGLRGMANLLGVPARFEGHVDDVASIWQRHHCLALPSRAEGLPLVVVEAMLSGRVPIVTAVAGNPEVVEDGVTGFLAATPTEAAYDDALERAWQQRDRLREIGHRAAARIRELVPPDPAKDFAERLIALIRDGDRDGQETT